MENFVVLLVCAMIGAALIVGLIWDLTGRHRYDWHPWDGLVPLIRWWKVTDRDGNVLPRGKMIMRRLRPDRVWEYRLATAEEDRQDELSTL